MTYESNGIVAKVPGELIAQASRTLSSLGAGKLAKLHAENDVPDIGRVRAVKADV